MSGPGPNVFELGDYRQLRSAIEYEARQTGRQLTDEELDAATGLLMDEEKGQRKYGASAEALRDIAKRPGIDPAQVERLNKMATSRATGLAQEGIEQPDNPLMAMVKGLAGGVTGVGSNLLRGADKIVPGNALSDIAQTLDAYKQTYYEPNVQDVTGAAASTLGETAGEFAGYGTALRPLSVAAGKIPGIGQAGKALASKFGSPTAAAVAGALPREAAATAMQNALVAPDWQTAVTSNLPVHPDFYRPENLLNVAAGLSGALSAGRGAARPRAAIPGPDVPTPAEVAPEVEAPVAPPEAVPSPTKLEAELPPEMQTSRGTLPAVEGAGAPATAPKGAFPGKRKFKAVERVSPAALEAKLPPELQTGRGKLPVEATEVPTGRTTRLAKVRQPDGSIKEVEIIEPKGTPPVEPEGGAAKKAAGFRGKPKPPEPEPKRKARRRPKGPSTD